jgi:hypothetical protein
LRQTGVYSRDAVLAGNGRWLFNKYDAFGRTIITGLYGGYNSRAELQSTLDVQTVLWESRSSTDPSGTGYTSSCQPVPLSIVEYHTISYFDDYAIPGIPYQPSGYSPMLKGLPTASRVKVLGSADQWLWTVQCYDDYGRVVRSWSQHHLGGTDITDNTYNFDGSLKGSTRSHSKGMATTTIATTYSYDHMGRPTTTTHSINGAAPTTISENVYNRDGAKVSEGVQRNWWRQGMNGSIKAHYDCIKAFSETDFTEDLKSVTIPVLVMHGEDDQIVPFETTGKVAATLLPNGKLISYPGFPHGMPTTEAATINKDLLAFFES